MEMPFTYFLHGVKNSKSDFCLCRLTHFIITCKHAHFKVRFVTYPLFVVTNDVVKVTAWPLIALHPLPFEVKCLVSMPYRYPTVRRSSARQAEVSTSRTSTTSSCRPPPIYWNHECQSEVLIIFTQISSGCKPILERRGTSLRVEPYSRTVSTLRCIF